LPTNQAALSAARLCNLLLRNVMQARLLVKVNGSCNQPRQATIDQR
jgi:hypothetical protein